MNAIDFKVINKNHSELIGIHMKTIQKYIETREGFCGMHLRISKTGYCKRYQ